MPKINFLITLNQGETFAHLSVLAAIRRGLSKVSQTTRVNGTPATDYLTQHYQGKTVRFPHYVFDFNLALRLLGSGSAALVRGQVLTVDLGALTVYVVNRAAGHSLIVERSPRMYYWLDAAVIRDQVKSFGNRLADSVVFYQEERRAPSRTSKLYPVLGSSTDLAEVCETLGISPDLFSHVDIELRDDKE